MQDSPLVSIVMPVFNDEDWITVALEGALNQTLQEIEIICVDDASTDATASIIAKHQESDARIRLVTLSDNRTAFQARRAGIEASSAPFVLFLDGDDEIDVHAAERSLRKAQEDGADLVGFGVRVFGPNGKIVGGYQERLGPKHESLEGPDILRALFPADQPAQGQLWRFLFSTELLRQAYAMFPADLTLSRINDLPITFLSQALAHRYVSIPDYLYHYHFRRGGSGHQVNDLEHFKFYAQAIASLDSMAPAVRSLARKTSDPEPILDGYQAARLSITGNVLDYLVKSADEESYDPYLNHLRTLLPEKEIVLAAAEYSPNAIPILAKHSKGVDFSSRSVRNVMLTTKDITTGGVSLVLLAQARYLSQAGMGVTIAARNKASEVDGLPEGVKYVEVGGGRSSAKLAEWIELCRRHSVDVIIDHQILYSRDWPSYALAAAAADVATIGWIHNFAMRPVYDLKDMTSFIREHASSLSTLVTLSLLDVSFWKLQGVRNTVFLPNPPSPMLLESVATSVHKPKPSEPLQLIWWGRLEEHTKQVRQLIEVASALRDLGVDFRMRVIGPEWAGLTPEKLLAYAERRGVAEHMDIPGPLRGKDLLEAIDQADLFVNTSIIEGYPLTLAEAQARGLPIAMYEMPWLAIVQGNEGIITAPQGDSRALALRISEVLQDPERYPELSRASLDSAQKPLNLDFVALYRQLVSGTLPAEYSPEPTLDDAKALIDYIVFFAEKNAGRRAKGGPAEPSAQKKLAYSILKRANRMVPGMKPLKRRAKRLLIR